MNDINSYTPMLQGNGSNRLSQITTRSITPVIDTITGDATITDGDYSVYINEYSKLGGGLRISTHKLLDACIMALTSVNHYRGSGELVTAVSISLRDYVSMLGKPSTKDTLDETRKRVKEDLEALYSVSIEWKERYGKKVKDYSKMRLLSSQGIKSGNINIGFSPEFASYLRGAYVMQYPKALLKIDERNASSYHIGRKMLLQYSIDNNRIKGTANIIGVRSLLDACPDIPNHAEVMSSDRKTDRRIKVAFENALNSLDFIKWKYSSSKGVPLTDKQLNGLTYTEYERLYILFDVKDYPDQTARLAVRADEAKEREEKRKYVSKKKVT